MKRLTFLLLCACLSAAASCDVRIGNTANQPNSPVSPSNPSAGAASISSFTTDNALLVLNQSTNLRWSASGTCRIDPFVGDVSNSGFTPITPLFTVTYSLSCSSNIQTVTRTVTVTVR